MNSPFAQSFKKPLAIIAIISSCVHAGQAALRVKSGSETVAKAVQKVKRNYSKELESMNESNSGKAAGVQIPAPLKLQTRYDIPWQIVVR
jgi:hypothetical protein